MKNTLQNTTPSATADKIAPRQDCEMRHNQDAVGMLRRNLQDFMKEIAHFYFDGGGWIIAMGIGFASGWLGGTKGAVAFIAIVVPFAIVLMFYHHP